MLVVVSLAWLLLTAPYAVFTLCVHSFSDDAHTRAAQRLGRVVCFLLAYINHAINFLLYCLVGRKFRVELKDMMSSGCPRARRWVATTASMRTTRSNCVELEPLNDTSRTAVHHHHHHGSSARRAFFVGDPANEVVVTPHCDDDDVIECQNDGQIKEDEL